MLFLLIVGFVSLLVLSIILIGRDFMLWKKIGIDKAMKTNFYIFLTIGTISFGVTLLWGLIKIWNT